MKIIGILCEEGLTSRSQGYNLYTKYKVCKPNLLKVLQHRGE